MAEQQLVDYINSARKAKQADDATKNLLIKNGWTDQEVSEAFAAVGSAQTQPQTQPQSQPQIQKTESEIKPQAEPQIQPQTQFQTQPQTQNTASSQPKIDTWSNRPTQQQTQTQPQIKAQSQYQPTQTAQYSAKTKSGGSHIFLKLFVVLIILLVLGGAGIFVAGQYFNLPYPLNIVSSWTETNREKPEVVFNKMATAMANLKSIHSSMKGEFIYTGGNQGKVSLNIESDADKANSKTNSNLTLNISQTTPAITPISVSANIVTSGKTLYIKANNITIPSEYTFGMDLSQITGKWVSIDQVAVQGLAGQDPTGMINSSAMNGDYSKQLQDLVLTGNLATVTKQFNDEMIGGQETYHYLLTIKKDDLKNFVAKLAKSQDLSKTNSTIDALGDINIDLWVGKEDHLIYQAKLSKNIDLSKLNANTKSIATINLSLLNSRFNQVAAIQEPKDAQPLGDILGTTSGLVPVINSDLRQLSSMAGEINSTNQDYSSLCQRGLLNGYEKTYGKQMISLNNDIVKQGGKKPACFAEKDSYCISTQLPDGNVVCAGPNGAIGKTKCVSSKTICQ